MWGHPSPLKSPSLKGWFWAPFGVRGEGKVHEQALISPERFGRNQTIRRASPIHLGPTFARAWSARRSACAQHLGRIRSRRA